MPDVLTMGTMDTLHPGHLGLIHECRILAGHGVITVAVNTDEFVARFKGVTPIFTVEERVLMLQGARHVHQVLVNDGDHQPDLILQALPQGGLLVVGDDWAERDYLAQLGLADDREFLERNGVELRYVARTGEWSTTAIRQRLAR